MRAPASVAPVGLAMALALGACRDSPSALPPLGEAIVIVDTDLPVPLLASRLRADVFTEDGTWYASRDFGEPDPSDWPMSFAIYSPDPTSERVVLLRLRAYPDGKVRDYRGERFAPRPSPTPPAQVDPPPAPGPGEAPRLLDATGNDVTPPTEPQPLLAVDQLVRLRIEPGTVGSARILLQGACLGTMADLANAQTCVDTENVRVDAAEQPLESDLSLPAQSAQGGFGAQTPCSVDPRPAHVAADGTPLFDEEVCVPGGVFIFGAPDESGVFDKDGIPERAALVEPFLIDRYEVTVGRLRPWATAHLDSGAHIIKNDAPIPAVPPDDAAVDMCTYSSIPMGRERYPVTCIDYGVARAFCQAEGGDLPTEVQWEYVTAAVMRGAKTAYPWGPPDDAIPDCSRSVLDRGATFQAGPGQCASLGYGPQPEDKAAHDGGDVSVGLGVYNLGGSVIELARDSFRSLGSRCWMSTPLESPACNESAPPYFSARGASWVDARENAYYGRRSGVPLNTINPFVGFRCVRKGQP